MKGNSGSQVAEKVANLPSPWPMPGANDLLDYWIDAWQRSILLLDVLRQRGNNYLEHNARKAPNVLSFDVELVLDGRSLPRPVNYGLVRIIPLHGISVDPKKRPFIVFDPRAGARSDDRGCVRGGGPLCRGGRQASPERRGQALSDRQLPGRLADHDDD